MSKNKLTRSVSVLMALSEYRAAMKKSEANPNETMSRFTALMDGFLQKFDWTATYSATDIYAQERRGDTRFVGVCYDACAYLAQKLTDAGIPYKSYWLADYEVQSLLEKFCPDYTHAENQAPDLAHIFDSLNNIKEEVAPLVYESLHSFNLCTIDGIYYFADNFFTPILSDGKHPYGFSNEHDALAFSEEALFDGAPHFLRAFDALTVEMGSHILYTLRRFYNKAD